MMDPIYMPTRGRVDRQLTLQRLPATILQRIEVVCHPGEEDALMAEWGDKVLRITPMQVNHIGELRQRCIDMAPTDYITFVDDSLLLQIRAESDTGESTKYPARGIIAKHFTPQNIERHNAAAFEWINATLRQNKHGMVGISRRAGNHNVSEEIVDFGRICSFWGINRKLFRQLPGNPQFSDMQLKEDFYIALHFLVNGIPTIMSYKYAYERLGGPNSKGGCSLYRTLSNSDRSAIELQKAFPKYVKLSRKGTKAWRGEFKESAIDVRINWQQAYEDGLRNKQNKHNGFFR